MAALLRRLGLRLIDRADWFDGTTTNVVQGVTFSGDIAFPPGHVRMINTSRA